MSSLIHSQISAAAPLKFRNGKASSHILLNNCYNWLFITKGKLNSNNSMYRNTVSVPHTPLKWGHITVNASYETDWIWTAANTNPLCGESIGTCLIICIKGNSHIWQSLSLLVWRWKAGVTLGWMGATFSGSGSCPHGIPPVPLCVNRILRSGRW